jgi:hypothetical protein
MIRRDLMYGSIVGYASLESSIDDGRMKKEEEGAKTHTHNFRLLQHDLGKVTAYNRTYKQRYWL